MPYPRLLMLAAVVIVVAALYLAQAVLMPVAMAIFLSFVLSPLVASLQRLRLGRAASVFCVALFALGMVGLSGWFVARQAVDLVTRLPEYHANLDAKLKLVRERIHAPLERASAAVHELEQSATGASSQRVPTIAIAPPPLAVAAEPSSLLGWTAGGIGALFSLLGTVGIVVLLVAIMLLQRGELRDRFVVLAGGGVVATTQALDEAAARLSRYLLALSAINAAHGTAVAAGLWMIGVPNSLLWGLLAGVLRFVPYAGPWIAAAFPLLFSFAISDGFTTPLLALGLFAALELMTNLVVEPLVLPNRIGVSSTALVVSVVFWTWLWGAPGLVLAVPLTVCVAVMGNHIPRMRFLSTILGDQSILSASLRVYQRLIVGETEEAWNLVAAERKEGLSVLESYDALLVPALCLAQRDRLDLVIDDATLAKVADRACELAEEIAARHDSKEAVLPLLDPLRVVCVAAGKEVDGAVAEMLGTILRRKGFDAVVLPHGTLVGEVLATIDSRRADAVCLSQLPPLSFSRLRYLSKRIAERFPTLPILAGTWSVSIDPVRLQQRLESGGGIEAAGSIAEMLEQLHRIAARVRPATNPADLLPSTA